VTASTRGGADGPHLSAAGERETTSITSMGRGGQRGQRSLMLIDAPHAVSLYSRRFRLCGVSGVGPSSRIAVPQTRICTESRYRHHRQRQRGRSARIVPEQQVTSLAHLLNPDGVTQVTDPAHSGSYTHSSLFLRERGTQGHVARQSPVYEVVISINT
jgi:hypothetical protein